MNRPLKNIRFDKKYRNKAENMCATKLRERGWLVTKEGYPDFICYRGNKIMLIEVKASNKGRLKKGQHRFMNCMKECGVKCYKWSPDNDWIQP